MKKKYLDLDVLRALDVPSFVIVGSLGYCYDDVERFFVAPSIEPAMYSFDEALNIISLHNLGDVSIELREPLTFKTEDLK